MKSRNILELAHLAALNLKLGEREESSVLTFSKFHAFSPFSALFRSKASKTFKSKNHTKTWVIRWEMGEKRGKIIQLSTTEICIILVLSKSPHLSFDCPQSKDWKIRKITPKLSPPKIIQENIEYSHSQTQEQDRSSNRIPRPTFYPHKVWMII